MIDSVQLASLGNEPAPRRKDSVREEGAQGFSYALAAASLEKNAAKSLEAHGAKPESNAPARQDMPAARESAKGVSAAGQAPDHSAAASTTAPEKAAAKAAPAQSTGTITMTPGAAVASPPPLPTGAQSPAALKPAINSAAREAGAEKARQAAAKAPRLQPAAPALKAEFAEILAKRLEKTSIFDLRLDPPELGRIEGRLSIDDDGKATLSLTFDNKDSFNRFSRDEQALRHALEQAGLQFDAGDFAFAFKERATDDFNSLAAGASVASAPLSAAYDPQFFAQWSAGALDIRI